MLADARGGLARFKRGEGVPEGMVTGWRAGYLPTWELLVGLCACTRPASLSTSRLLIKVRAILRNFRVFLVVGVFPALAWRWIMVTGLKYTARWAKYHH